MQQWAFNNGHCHQVASQKYINSGYKPKSISLSINIYISLSKMSKAEATATGKK